VQAFIIAFRHKETEGPRPTPSPGRSLDPRIDKELNTYLAFFFCIFLECKKIEKHARKIIFKYIIKVSI